MGACFLTGPRTAESLTDGEIWRWRRFPRPFPCPFDGDCSRLDTALLVIAADGESVSVKRGSARKALNNGWKVAAGLRLGRRQRMKSDLGKLV